MEPSFADLYQLLKLQLLHHLHLVVLMVVSGQAGPLGILVKEDVTLVAPLTELELVYLKLMVAPVPELLLKLMNVKLLEFGQLGRFRLIVTILVAAAV